MGALGGRFHEVAGIIPVIRVESIYASIGRLEMGKRSTIRLLEARCYIGGALTSYRATRANFRWLVKKKKEKNKRARWSRKNRSDIKKFNGTVNSMNAFIIFHYR